MCQYDSRVGQHLALLPVCFSDCPRQTVPLRTTQPPRAVLLIEDKLVDEKLLSAHFCCNLAACKGACCVAGDGGAPLEQHEVQWLEDNRPALAPYLTPAGNDAIAAQGAGVRAADGTWETPLLDTQECAYLVYDDAGIAKCGIEHAWQHGAVDQPKPISCHLYPLRVRPHSGFPMLVYHKWDICAPARAQGSTLGIPVYKFLKGPIIRAFGETFYDALDTIARDKNRPPAP